MTNANVTGIKPAYRRLTMDMSITLGQVLNFEASKPGSFHVVNVRGQVNSAYAPVQVQDFMDWLLSVSPDWDIQTLPTNTNTVDVINETFNVYKFQTAYTASVFVGHLARMLHQGSVTILMSVIPVETIVNEDTEDTSLDTYRLCIEILQRHHVKVMSFTSSPSVCDIRGYTLKDDSLVTIDDSQNVMIEPFQVAAVTQHNSSTMGQDRSFLGVRVLCDALVSRNGTIESISPLSRAIAIVDNIIMTNLVEYGFKLPAQLCLLAKLHSIIFDRVRARSQKKLFQPEESFYINIDFTFLDDDRNAGSGANIWSLIYVKLVPFNSSPDTIYKEDDAVLV